MESRWEGRGRGRRSARGSRDPVQSAPVIKPTFKKVEDIEPEMTGINLKVIVVATQSRSEFLMGDETGTVTVVVSNAGLQERLREGVAVVVRNGFVVMKDDAFIRIQTNEWGKVQISEECLDFVVKKNNNISEIEYTVE